MAAPGDRLADRYELVAPIGAGGMATVWRAFDLRLHRAVAIKLLRPQFAEDDEFVRRFESEARHAASLAHPNVATVFDTGGDGDQPFIVMELADGPTVADLLRDRGPLPPPVAVEVAAAAARALAAAHRRGLIHRDVKPANLLLARDGTVRLADFGIARALTTSRATMPGTVLGSIPYLSPEQARGEDATAAGDIFSLGVVLFEMLTGRLPWTADTPAALATVRLTSPPAPPSAVKADLPPGLDAVVARALDLDPTVRYPSARAFAETLETWHRRFADTAPEPTPDLADTIAMLVAGGTPAAGPFDGADPAGSAARAPENEMRIVASAEARPNAGRHPAPAAAIAAAGLALGTHRPASTERLPTDRYRLAPPPVATPRRRAEDPDRGRLAALAGLGAMALLIGVGVAAMLSSTPRGAVLEATGTPAAAIAASALPGQSAVVILASPSPTPTVAPTPTLVPTQRPTPGPTPTASPEPTPRRTSRPGPTPAPTPAPTSRPVAGSAGSTAASRAVAAFYGAVEDHDWDRAIALWSPSIQQRYPPDDWLIGRFRRTTDIEITRLETAAIDRDAGTARVATSLIERRSVEPSPRRFTGAWNLVRIDGVWLLDDPDF